MKRKKFHLPITCFGNFKNKVHLAAKEVKLLKVNWAVRESWEVDKHLAGWRRAGRLVLFVDVWRTWITTRLPGHHENQTPMSVSKKLLQRSFSQNITEKEKIQVITTCSSFQALLFCSGSLCELTEPEAEMQADICDAHLWSRTLDRAKCKKAACDALPPHGAHNRQRLLQKFWQFYSNSTMCSDTRRRTICTKVHCSMCRCTGTMVLLKWHNFSSTFYMSIITCTALILTIVCKKIYLYFLGEWGFCIYDSKMYSNSGLLI